MEQSLRIAARRFPLRQFLNVVLLGCFSHLVFHGVAAPVGSSFTYQGRLLDSSAPANGTYDLEFHLFDSETGGNTLGAVLHEDVLVANGLFNVELDFGADAFNEQARWLAMGARNGTSTGAFVALPMRQALIAVPQSQFALVAGTVLDSSITGAKIAAGAITTEKIALGAVTSEKIAPGAVVKSVNGLQDGVTLAAGDNIQLTTNGNQLSIHVPDGIGSGLSADLLDGKDSDLFALEVDVRDRVSKDGDTMRGTLTLQPHALADALIIKQAFNEEEKLKIHSSGSIETLGGLTIGGNVDIAGSLAARNLPFVQSTNRGVALIFGSVISVHELAVVIPAAGVLLVQCYIDVRGEQDSGEPNLQLRLERLGAVPEENVELGSAGGRLAPDHFENQLHTPRRSVWALLPVSQGETVRVRSSVAYVGQDDNGNSSLFAEGDLAALYFPQ